MVQTVSAVQINVSARSSNKSKLSRVHGYASSGRHFVSGSSCSSGQGTNAVENSVDGDRLWLMVGLLYGGTSEGASLGAYTGPSDRVVRGGQGWVGEVAALVVVILDIEVLQMRIVDSQRTAALR